MTREEAIKGLKVLAKDFSGYRPNEKMFNMAIEALEQPEIIRCRECRYWDKSTLEHCENDFREWDEAECLQFGARDGYHEIDWCTEADDFCSNAERRTDE